MNAHQFVECFCGKPGCAFCHGVRVCKKCNGADTPQHSTLTTECYGYFADWSVLELIQDKKLDYKHGKWFGLVDNNMQEVDLYVYMGVDDICEGLT